MRILKFMNVAFNIEIEKAKEYSSNWKCRWVEVKPRTKYILHNFTPQTFYAFRTKQKEKQ